MRYFNAAGYDINRRISGKEISPKNLFPIIMETAIGLRQKVSIFGNDYFTKDGTSIRDYIHVNDLSKKSNWVGNKIFLLKYHNLILMGGV